MNEKVSSQPNERAWIKPWFYKFFMNFEIYCLAWEICYFCFWEQTQCVTQAHKNDRPSNNRLNHKNLDTKPNRNTKIFIPMRNIKFWQHWQRNEGYKRHWKRWKQTWLLNWNGPNAPHKKLKNLKKSKNFVKCALFFSKFGKNLSKITKNPQKICAFGAKSKNAP